MPRGRRPRTSAWYCDGCAQQPHSGAWACRLCCGYTRDPSNWFRAPAEPWLAHELAKTTKDTQ